MEQVKYIIENLKRESDYVYCPERFDENCTKNMLIIIPELSLGGTLTVLLEMIHLMKKQGYRLYVISSVDGPVFREKLLDLGITVVIRPYANCEDWYRKFLQTAFDCVFINSAVCYYYSYLFINTDVKVLWWLHETRAQLETIRTEFPNLYMLSSNFKLAGVTKAVEKGIKELYQKQIDSLPMPIADHRGLKKDLRQKEKVVFLIPAAYTVIKGQDILLQAIQRLPESYKQKSQFIFCGYLLEGQKEYHETIFKFADNLENVTMLGELSKEEVYNEYQKCHCVVAPSRLDATPTTIVEGMMFERLCIVSDATGISEYMTDCENGFIFPSENVDELLKRLMLVIEDWKQLDFIAKAGRKIYEETFAPEHVEEQFRTILGDE